MATPPFLPDETKPADDDIVSQFPAVERTFRDVIEDWLLVDHDTAGEHKQVTLPERASNPSAASDTGFLYTKDDGADTELYYRDDSGNVVQITEDGALAVTTFPAGTKMLFVQTAAPTGWTKDVDQNDKALRVVSGTPGTGGATAFTTVFGSSKATASYTLLTADIPAHVHTVTTSGTGSGAVILASTSGGTPKDTSSTGGGGGHTHDLSLDLQYMDVIKATKD